jgi:P4 family phage/plasmid primase-like protien
MKYRIEMSVASVLNTGFNTKTYCKEHDVPCFTQMLVGSKRATVIGWNKIEKYDETMVNPAENGFAIVTGPTHVMVDIDLKHAVPNVITEMLMANCSGYERTPGGYHFYFVTDERTGQLTSKAGGYWDGVKQAGLDFRSYGGLSWCDPSWYLDAAGERKEYKWMHGNLSTASRMPDVLWKSLDNPGNLKVKNEIIEPTENLQETADWVEVETLVRMLSAERATGYDSWRNVIFAVRNVENSKRARDLCHEFSRKAANYERKSVDKKFDRRGAASHPLTLKSLHYWAREDAPEAHTMYQLSRLYENDETLVRELIDGPIALAQMYLRLFGDDLLLIKDADRVTTKRFFIFNYVTKLWDNVDKELLAADICTELSAIVKEKMDGILSRLSTINRAGLDDKGKELLDRQKATVEMMKKLYMSIQDVGKGCCIASHVMKMKMKTQYDSQTMNKNIGLLSVKNGMVDLRTGELLERVREHYQTFYIDINYNKDAPTALMERFINGMFLPSEEEVKNLLCNAIGYSITGETDKKVLPVLLGDGCNGKSELINILKEVLGKHYISTVDYADLAEKGTSKNVDTLFNARFARIIIIMETGRDAEFKEGKLKAISGRDEVNVSAKFKGDEKMKPECVVWIISNFKPRFSGDKSFWNRITSIMLNMQFMDRTDFRWDDDAFERGEIKEKDAEFIKELYKTQEGILNWLVKQAMRHYVEGIVMPKAVVEQKVKYMNQCVKEANKSLTGYMARTWEKAEDGETVMTTIVEQYRADFPEDALLSDGQVEAIVTSELKRMDVQKKREDKVVKGVRTTRIIWRVKIKV